MTDDFVKKAFEEAYENTPFENPDEEKEYQAYKQTIQKDHMFIFAHVGTIVGLDKMDRLSKAVIESDNTKTFAEFIKGILTIGFSIGYKTAKKEK